MNHKTPQSVLHLLASLLLLGALAACHQSSYRSHESMALQKMAVPTEAIMAQPPQIPPPDGEGDSLPPDFNTEEYDRIYENPFLLAQQNPLSTFSIDVDVASYANIRRFLNDNLMPPPDAVRIEEMLNYFNYDYPAPDSEHPFSIITETSQSPWNPEHQLVHIGIQGKEIAKEKLPPSNLVFLFDVSGSMNTPDKLPLLKSAFQLLVEALSPADRVAIVVYAGAAGQVLPSTPASEKQHILDAIERLEAGGSTAGGAGIELAYRIARENHIPGGNNRVILATDGDFNIGPSSDAALVRLIEEKREEGVFLSVLGFGTGNLKDSKMEQLADKGNGNYAYIDNILEAKKVLVSEMGGTLYTIAKDVKIQVEFNPALVKGYRLIGYENRIMAAEDFDDDKKDAGELGAGHSVTAIYEMVPIGANTEIKAPGELKYQATVPTQAATGNEIMTVKFRYKQPDGDQSQLITHIVPNEGTDPGATSDNFRFSAAVAGFGMLLRDSKHKAATDYDLVLRLATGAKGPDVHGYRAEFIRMVEKARLMDKRPAAANKE